jgi:hypothetical protein
VAKRAARSKVTLEGKLMFPNDYIAAAEFKGRDVTLTIAAINAEHLQLEGGTKKEKMVMRFQGTVKKFVCNKTNANSIAQIPGYGSEASAWVGKRITLYPTKCLAFGEMVECIRVREVKPPEKGQAPTPAPAVAEPAHDGPPPDFAGSPDGEAFADDIAAEMAKT